MDNAQLLSKVVSEQQGGGAAGLARPVMGAATARGLNEDLARYLAELEQQGTVELAKLAQAMAFVEAQRAKSFDLGWLDISLKLGQLERDVRAHTKMAQESLQKQQAALGEAAKNTKSSTNEANEASEGCASAACVRSELLLAFESESQSLATTLASLNLGSARGSMKLDAFLAGWGLAGDAVASPEQEQEHAQAGEINELVGQRWTQATQAYLAMASEVERFPVSVQQSCMPAMLNSYDALSAELLALRDQYLGNAQSVIGELDKKLEAAVSGADGWLGRWKSEHSEVFETSLSEETEKAKAASNEARAPYADEPAVIAAQATWLARLEV
ncbi:MAG: hypothetical protein RBU37_27400, partial [Myxococcota bacterium]|nr:hypothetical protein [Myxococcota bacterium]